MVSACTTLGRRQGEKPRAGVGEGGIAIAGRRRAQRALVWSGPATRQPGKALAGDAAGGGGGEHSKQEKTMFAGHPAWTLPDTKSRPFPAPLDSINNSPTPTLILLLLGSRLNASVTPVGGVS